jgi:hypothetical protein
LTLTLLCDVLRLYGTIQQRKHHTCVCRCLHVAAGSMLNAMCCTSPVMTVGAFRFMHASAHVTTHVCPHKLDTMLDCDEMCWGGGRRRSLQTFHHMLTWGLHRVPVQLQTSSTTRTRTSTNSHSPSLNLFSLHPHPHPSLTFLPPLTHIHYPPVHSTWAVTSAWCARQGLPPSPVPS